MDAFRAIADFDSSRSTVLGGTLLIGLGSFRLTLAGLWSGDSGSSTFAGIPLGRHPLDESEAASRQIRIAEKTMRSNKHVPAPVGARVAGADIEHRRRDAGRSDYRPELRGRLLNLDDELTEAVGVGGSNPSPPMIDGKRPTELAVVSLASLEIPSVPSCVTINPFPK